MNIKINHKNSNSLKIKNLFMINKLKHKNKMYLTNTSSSLHPNILILDSGVGGLSVYKNIWKILSNFHVVYVFDNVAFPYGEKSEKFIIQRVIKIINAVKKIYPLTLTIIACNTISIVSLPILREKFDFPIIGVLPAIKTAIQITSNKIIGLLATNCTINYIYKQKLIKHFKNKYQIKMLGSNELVELAEAKLHGEIISTKKLYRILEPWLLMSELPDTIILGCTHFPLIQNELYSVLPKKTNFVDSSINISNRILWSLKNKKLNFKFTKTRFIKVNTAYCIDFTSKTKKLLPILNQYGFNKLKKLTFND